MQPYPRRRIFARRKRLSPAAIVLRSAAILAFGVTAALGANLVATQWPEDRSARGIVSRAPALQPEEPVMRVAAATPGRPSAQAREPARKP